MPAKTLMIQGASSSAGKSLLAAAFCRIFARRGLRVAPFKSQNMSNNAGVCPDGAEIGRAQYVQAIACGIEPTADMNPVLLKPEADARSQVVVMGKPWTTLPARSYYERKQHLWQVATAALDRLCSDHELVIIEGAGSPVELNLKRGDIVNMAIAGYAQAPVLLVGDIDRGGIFAQLLGTLWLLEANERSLVRGLLVNKFRGDPTLFEDGVRIIEERGGVPVLGVIPWVHNVGVSEEDAVALDAPVRSAARACPALSGNPSPQQVDIAVLHLPHIANFDDFDPLAAEAGVRVRYVTSVAELGAPQAVIIPGTKSTMSDLAWLRATGLAGAIQRQAHAGVAIAGVCGGYQMLGRAIHDPLQVEAATDSVAGLNLLPVETIFAARKETHQAKGTVSGGPGWLAGCAGQPVEGYEIHMGRTDASNPWLRLSERSKQAVTVLDGSASADGRIWGCYLHGLFGNAPFRRAWLASLGWQASATEGAIAELATNLDRLANVVEAHVDMKRLESIIWGN